MKWDFAIGNPAYQESQDATSDKPVYNFFMDEAEKVAEKVEMITPARFLFNAGKTPKLWNEKKLQDTHFKVLSYEPDSRKVFMNAEIKGGVAISYWDSLKDFGKIEVFTPSSELNSILTKVKSHIGQAISSIVFSPESYKFTEGLYAEHPEIKTMETQIDGKLVPLISKGHDFDLTSNIFEKLSNIVFFEERPADKEEYIQVLGRKDNVRLQMWIKKKYVAPHANLDKYKLAFPKVNGSGSFGEVLTPPVIIGPGIAHTQTFLSMGTFQTDGEVRNLTTYLKSKFSRTMLGILKVTQDNKKNVWKYVPLQDFTDSSDINWNTSIANIDKQLYKKYGLSQEEIDFIETHVKEMA